MQCPDDQSSAKVTTVLVIVLSARKTPGAKRGHPLYRSRSSGGGSSSMMPGFLSKCIRAVVFLSACRQQLAAWQAHQPTFGRCQNDIRSTSSCQMARSTCSYQAKHTANTEERWTSTQTLGTACQESAVQEAVQRRWAAQATRGEHAVPQVQPAGQHIIPAHGARCLEEAQQTIPGGGNLCGSRYSLSACKKIGITRIPATLPCWAPLQHEQWLRSNIAAGVWLHSVQPTNPAALHVVHMQSGHAASAPPNAVDAQPAVSRLPLVRRAPTRLVGMVVPPRAKHLLFTAA